MQLVQPGWKYVVKNDQELLDALASNKGFFIQAGTYNIDPGTITIGTSTQRTIQGAGRDEVTINLTGSDHLDFAGSFLVSLSDLTVVNAGTALQCIEDALGCFRVHCADGVNNGFRTCGNLVSCTTTGNGIDSVDANRAGFSGCFDLDGCVSDGDSRGFHDSNRVTSCRATFSDVTPSPEAGFDSCQELSGCFAEGAWPEGFSNCDNVSACRAANSLVGYDTCTRVTGSSANNTVGTGFNNCNELAACKAQTAGGVGFFDCDQAVGCRTNSCVGNSFEDCDRISSCWAQNGDPGAVGYENCDYVMGCRSSGNDTGFDNCTNVISPNDTDSAGTNTRYIDNDMWDAIEGASSPSSSNVFITDEQLSDHVYPGSLSANTNPSSGYTTLFTFRLVVPAAVQTVSSSWYIRNVNPGSSNLRMRITGAGGTVTGADSSNVTGTSVHYVTISVDGPGSGSGPGAPVVVNGDDIYYTIEIQIRENGGGNFVNVDNDGTYSGTPMLNNVWW
jgi:hypothetical protein